MKSVWSVVDETFSLYLDVLLLKTFFHFLSRLLEYKDSQYRETGGLGGTPPGDAWRGGTALRASLLDSTGTFTWPQTQPVLGDILALLTHFTPALAQLSSPQPGQDAALHLPLHLVRTEGKYFYSQLVRAGQVT